MPSYDVTCAGCGRGFTAKSPRAKWHSPGCKKQAQRNPPAPEPPAADAEHPIVAAVRKELDEAKRTDTVDGQAALLLAGQAATAGATNVATLISRMREVLDAALGRKPGSEPPAEPAEPAPAPVVDDEVTKARQARERKLAQARRSADRA